MPERRTTPRKKFDYYLRIVDDDTQELLGHLVEVSSKGFQLDRSTPLPVDKEYYLRVELTPDLGNRPFIVFIGRTKWCNMDDLVPNVYHVGIQMMEIVPEDREIFLNIVAKFGK